MKKLILFISALALLVGCSKDGPESKTVTLNLGLTFAETSQQDLFKNKEITIRVKNMLNGATTEFKHVAGPYSIPGLSAGTYDIEASASFTQKEFQDLTQQEVSESGITFNASAKQVRLLEDSNLDLSLVAGVSGDFVIKQVYYAGSHRTNGAIYRDQFFEIYNNTDRILYADSLYFGRLWGKQTANDEKHYMQEKSKQLDWSRSLNMTMGNVANTDYVYLRDLFMIPGTGKTYPIEPGKSIVIAQNALNHKSPFTGADGKEISVKDPSLTVDLSKADFEVYYGDIPGNKPFASDIDNASVPNVEILHGQANDWILDNLGRDSYVIFKGKTRAEVDILKEYHAPLISAPSATAAKYRQLPISWIMDAVEAQPNVESSQIPKKLNATVDAGFQMVSEGSYSSQSIIRKTSKEVNGRKILQDSNNSSNDFISIKANPRGFSN